MKSHCPQKMSLGQTVFDALIICLGLFVAVGCLFSFWIPELNRREYMMLKPFGMLLLAVFGWCLVVFALSLKRGTWRSHCESQRNIFRGVDDPVAKKRGILVCLTPEQILAANMVNLAAAMLMSVGIRLHWHDPITPIIYALGLFSHPILTYIAIRKITETGFAWSCFFSAAIGLLGMSLWTWTTYFLTIGRFGN
jgi:hypothetical protein